MKHKLNDKALIIALSFLFSSFFSPLHLFSSFIYAQDAKGIDTKDSKKASLDDKSEPVTEPVIENINVEGLERTKSEYVQGLLEGFKGTSVSKVNTERVTQALMATGLFYEAEVVVNANSIDCKVKEKHAFLPLVLAAYSKGFVGGAFLVDSNFRGKNEFATLGLAAKSDSKSAFAAYSHPAGGFLHPGFAISGSVATGNNTISDADDNDLLEYDAQKASAGITLSISLLRLFTLATGFEYKYSNPYDSDPSHIFGGNLALYSGFPLFPSVKFSGVYPSMGVMHVKGGVYRDACRGDFMQTINAGLSIQQSIFSPLRLCSSFNVARVWDPSIFMLLSPQDCGCTILGSSFACKEMLFASAGLEWAAIDGKKGLLTVYIDGELAASNDAKSIRIYNIPRIVHKVGPYTPRHSIGRDEGFIDYGIDSGIKIYLKRVKLSALRFGYAYNLSRYDGFFSISLGFGG